MSKKKDFIKNTLILFIGKFATQFTSFLLLPLYTHYLLTDDYGWVDFLQTYITLFVPILTLRLDSALFRFLIDNRKNENGKKKIISNTIFVLLLSLIFTIIFCLILIFFIRINYFYETLINIVILMVSNLLLQVLRGLGKNKEYSICSIITGLTCLLLNIVLIIKFNFSANSILISSSISNLLVIIFIIFKVKIFKYISLHLINKNTIKQLLKYSLPMIPNSLSWWIINVSDRTIIKFVLGNSINAIYSVSCKFSNLLNSVFSIFNMSWQESASLHINDEDRDDFFSDIINKMIILFSSVSILIIGILPVFYNLIIGKSYIESYRYIPILLYANIWNIIINLIGGIYVALKKTKKIASTTIISAVINIFINLVLIKFIGLYAACISTFISYFAMTIYRYYDLKKYMNVAINFNSILIFTILFSISSALYYLNNNYFNMLNLIFVIIDFIFNNNNIIRQIKKKFIKIINKKK